MKKTGYILALIIALAVLTSCYGVDVSDIGSIDNKPIYKKEFLYYAELSKATVLMQLRQEGQPITDLTDPNTTTVSDGRTVTEVAKEDALSAVKTMHILSAKAADFGIALDSAAKEGIERLKNEIITQFAGKGEKFGLSNKDFERIATTQYLAAQVQGELAKDESLSSATDEEIADEYLKNYIRAKHILISKNPVSAEDPIIVGAEIEGGIGEIEPEGEMEDPVEKAREEAAALLLRVKAGESFDKLMKEFSSDPGLEGSPEGYIFAKGEMVEEFETAAFALDVGAVSEELVETSFGFHILKRESLSAAGEDFESKKESLSSKILNKKFEDKVSELGADLEIKINEKEIEKIKF